MGTLGLCETCLHETCLHRSMASGQKEHRTGFVFSSLQPQYLLEATHGKKNLFLFSLGSVHPEEGHLVGQNHSLYGS